MRFRTSAASSDLIVLATRTVVAMNGIFNGCSKTLKESRISIRRAIELIPVTNSQVERNLNKVIP